MSMVNVAGLTFPISSIIYKKKILTFALLAFILII